MNPRWLKQNMVVVVSAVAFVVVLVLIILMERRAAGQGGLIVDQLGSQQAELDRLRSLNPTPATENIDALKRDREQIQRLYQDLQKRAVRDPIPVPELQRDIEFSQLMRDTIGRLISEGGRNGVKIVDNFAFGFSRYDQDFPCRHPAAKADECRKLLALLAKQVLVVEKLSDLLIKSKVDSINKIHRTEVEPGAASEDALAVPIGNDPKALYKTYPFELEFTCDTDALRSFLNSLTQSDWFFAVRSVKVESTIVTGGGTTEAVPGEPVRSGDRRLLAVTIRVDLVEFTPAEPAAGDKT